MSRIRLLESEAADFLGSRGVSHQQRIGQPGKADVGGGHHIRWCEAELVFHTGVTVCKQLASPSPALAAMAASCNAVLP